MVDVVLQDGLNDHKVHQLHFAARDAGPDGTDSPDHCSRSSDEAERDLLEWGKIKSETAKAGVQLG